MTIDDLLRQAHLAGVERLDARILVAAELGRDATWVIAHGEHRPSPAYAGRLQAAFARRAAAEPLAYLLGRREFYGLELQVDQRVLVPRPETEDGVDWALEIVDGLIASAQDGGETPRPRVVDLGTGSGAIALALKNARPGLRVTGSDDSADALDCARANATRLGLVVQWRLGHWWAAHGGDRFDLAITNPPYVRHDDPHLPSLRHEPRRALVSGTDGLDSIRAIVGDAPGHLAPGGWLLLEHGHDQGAEVRGLLARRGFIDVTTRRDLAGHERWTAGCTPPAAGR